MQQNNMFPEERKSLKKVEFLERKAIFSNIKANNRNREELFAMIESKKVKM